MLSSHNTNPSKKAWIQLNHVILYLKATKEWGTTFGLMSPFQFSSVEQPKRVFLNCISVFSDADYAMEKSDHVSVTGHMYITMMYGSPINWTSKKHCRIIIHGV
jgi:hypothetical protein